MAEEIKNISVSTTAIGIAIVTVLQVILPLFGLQVPEGSLTQSVQGVITLIGLVVAIVGQIKRKDMKYGLIRK